MKFFIFLLWINIGILYAQQHYYVSPDGNDNNDGLSITTPLKSIQRAVDLANAGDTIFLFGGIYEQDDTSESFVLIQKSGNISAPIVIKNYSNQKPIIHFQGWHGILFEGAKHIVIDGLTIKGNNSNISFSYALSQANNLDNPLTSGHGIGITWNSDDSTFSEHIVIRNCTIYDCGGHAIYWFMSDWITVESNVIYDCCFYSPHGTSAIAQLRPRRSDFSSRPKMRIERNLIFSNRNFIPNVLIGKYTGGHGIYIDNSYPTPISLCYYTGQTLIANNIIISNGGAAIYVVESDRILLLHNTCLNNDKQNQGSGECFLYSLTGVEVYNNFFLPSASNIAVNAENLMLVNLAANAYPEGSFCAIWSDTDIYVDDPNFAYFEENDILQADFNLLAGSLLIDAAYPDTLIYNDFFNNQRPIGYAKDIGAVEFDPTYTINEIHDKLFVHVLVNEFNVEIYSEKPISFVIVYDLSGKVVYNRFTYSINAVVIDKKVLPKNICFFVISTNDNIYCVKTNL